MKRIITVLVFLTTSLFYAQTTGITYQAVIYNPAGEILPGNNDPNAVLANKDICLRFSIKDAATNLEYQETQKVKTDEFGMVNVVIGQGNQVSGYASNFDAILWNSTTKKLQVEMDTTGNCSIFIEVSNQNFSAVPFAYASKTAENVSGIVAIVNGGTGATTVSGAKTNLGLNNVDNTSDANKPISTATQAALDTKAPLASPALTGTPTVPTAANGTNTNQIASTAFVQSAITAAATPDATATVKGKLQLTGDLGGTADAPTVPGLVLKAPLDSPQFIGTPSLPSGTIAITQAANNNSTAVATTAYVANALSASNANARSTDLDMAGNSISNALAVRAGNLQIVDEALHPFFGGTDDNSVTILNRENNVTQFLDGRTGSPILAITNSVNSNDVFGTPTAEEGKIGIGTTTPSEKLEVKGKIKAESFIKENGTASQFLKADGSVDNTQYAGLSSPVFTGTPTLPTGTIAITQSAGNNTTAVATTAFVNSVVAANTVVDATTTIKGKIKLAGDLGGTADLPTVPGLTTKENAANKSTNTSLGTSDVLFPTQNAVKTYVDNQVSSGVVDATTTTKGKIKLAGDLAGTADAPTVPGLANKENTITAGTTAQYYRGDKTWQTLNNTAVGLGNVDNTSDTSKPISTDTQAALDLKANLASPTFTGDAKAATATAGDNDTSIATTAFVSTAITNSVTPDATTSNLGKIQLGGDLAGPSSSALAPIISNGAITTLKLADASVTNAKIGEIVSINKGGTGSNMTTTAGYVKQATIGANLTTVSSIPVADVDGAVRKVNGVVPDANGNVAVIIGRVFTGATVDPNLATSIISASPAKQQSDIYIVADGSNPNNGRTFIYDGADWLEVATDLSTTDARYVNVAGDTMEGNLIVPTTKKLILTDSPTNATDAANKLYVDNQVANAAPPDATTLVKGKIKLAGDLEGTADLPTVTNAAVIGKVLTGYTAGAGTVAATDNILHAIQKVDGNVATKLGGSGTTNYLPKFSASKMITDSKIFDNGTNVGIGTATPISSLHIDNPLAATNTVNADAKVLTLSRPDTSNIKWDNIAQFKLGSYEQVPDNTTDAAKSRLDLTLNDNDDIVFSNVMTWQANGNVGIGTNAPTNKIEVVGDVKARNSTGTNSVLLNTSLPSIDFTSSSRTFRLGSYTGSTFNSQIDGTAYLAGVSGITQLSLNTPATQPITFATDNWVERMRIQPISGNVGVGITTPSAKFHANTPSGTNNVARFTTEGTGTNWANIGLGNNSGVWSSIASGDSKFQIRNFTNNTSILHADLVSGNVGIGITTPATRLHVNSASPATNTVNTEGVFRMMRPRNDGVKWENIAQFNLGSYAVTTPSANTNATSRLDLAMNDGDGVATNNVMTWFANGYVGIGTTAPAAQLHTTGSVRFAGAGTPGAGRVLTSDASGNATWQNAVGSTTVSSKTADYTLTSSDNAGFIVVNSATLVTITVPSTLSAGFYCQIIQQGVGQVSVVGDTGVSVTSAMGTKSRTTGSSIGVMLTTSTTAFLSGDTGF